jgi:CRP-like cAMP-binding protein
MATPQAIDVAEALGESEIFGALLEDELAALVHLGTRARYPSGRTIFEKGDPGDSLMIVLAGRIKIRTLSADGREIVLNFVEAGQMFGEIALLDGKPRTAGAATLEACEFFILRRQAVLSFLEENPLAAIRLIGVLCQRLRRTTQMFEEKLLLSMAPRVARALLRLAGEHGRKTEDGVLIDLKLSQSELGSYIGLSRENVNRQLGAWREGGIIGMREGRIVIHMLRDLEMLAGEPV